MFDRLFRRGRGPGQPALLRPDRPGQAEPITVRAGMVVFDPVIEAVGGARLSEHLGWYNPDALARQYMEDLRAASGGVADYRIVERIELDAYPPKVDGFRYDDASFLRCWGRRAGFHSPDTADYEAILAELGLARRVDAGAWDEVWLFGFPYAGFYESRMLGPGAFWCNAPPGQGAGCRRRFVVMGFNYERDVGCMLENFGHRVESIMAHVYRRHSGEANLWERFARHERAAPGRAECGNVHFAPSSAADYDWGNPRPVLSRADAWYAFPDLSAPPRRVSCAEWGGGDMRAHHLWWLDHLPRVRGASDGVSHNWWAYVLRPDAYEP